MIFWEKVLLKYPMKLQPSDDDIENLPIVFHKWFIAYNQGERVIFARLHDDCMWNVPPSNNWTDYNSNKDVSLETLTNSIPYFHQVTDFDLYMGTAKFNNKDITWTPIHQWKYRNNRTVYFNETLTKRTNSELSSDEGSNKSNPDKDTAQVKDLLRQAEATVISAIQKLSSRAGTPDPTDLPLPKASLLLGKSKLSTTEVSQTATSPVSKGKAPAPPPIRTCTSSSSPRPTQTTALSSTTKLPAPPPRNPKGTTPLVKSNPPVSTSKLPPQPPGGNPPALPPTAPMAQPNPPPHILGTAPKSYNGKGDTAITFWNSLENYFTVNATTFNTNAKKVSSALTYFKQGTQAGDWASDHITTILAGNPVNYGT